MRNFFERIVQSPWMLVLIVLTSLFMHLEIFNRDLVGFHVWRQTQTQNTILSFAEEDPNIFNPRKNERGDGDGIFRMEFPLAQWITALPVRAGGDDVLWSRIINFVFGVLSVVGIFFLARLFFRSTFLALAASWILSFTPVFYYYTINPLPDNLALTFSIWAIYFLIRWYQNQSILDLALAVGLSSLSGLCKLPFALIFIIPFILVFWQGILMKKGLRYLTARILIIFFGVIPVFSWYIWVIPDWKGNGIVNGIFSMDEQQVSQFWYYLWYNLRTNIPELIVGLSAMPLFIYGIVSIPKLWREHRDLCVAFGSFVILISALMVFEMNMIEKVHDYYFLPFLPFFVLVSLYGLKRLSDFAKRRSWLWVPLIVILLSMPVYSYFRIQTRWDRVGINEDLLTYKNELRAAVPDTALVCAGNDISHHIFLYYINKKGWVFEQDWMGRKKLEGLIALGCEYLYSDSRHVDQNPDIQSVFGTKVATFGTINVYKLVDSEEKELVE